MFGSLKMMIYSVLECRHLQAKENNPQCFIYFQRMLRFFCFVFYQKCIYFGQEMSKWFT